MKRILYLALLLPLFSLGQSSRISTPQGAVISYCPGTTINQNSGEVEFFRDTIPANSLMPNRNYDFTLINTITTPLVSIPGVTIRFKLGTEVFTLMSSNALVGGVTNGLFTIEGSLVAKSGSTQFIFAKVMQPNGSILTLGSTYTPTGTFSRPNNTALPFVITIQFTGVGLGVSSLTNQWLYRAPF